MSRHGWYLISTWMVCGCAGQPQSPLVSANAKQEQAPPAVHSASSLEFERILERKGSLFDALLSIDRLIYPKHDLTGCRPAFEKILKGVQGEFRDRPPPVEHPVEAARLVLKSLKGQGVSSVALQRQEPEVPEPDAGFISSCVMTQKGTCMSLTVLSMAILESIGLSASSVEVPGHIFLTLRDGNENVPIETTTFGAPRQGEFIPRDLPKISRDAGWHLGYPLGKKETAWAYLVNCLGHWIPDRNKDEETCKYLLAAEKALRGSCLSIEFSRAKIDFHRSRLKPQAASDAQAARKRAEERLLKLHSWLPADPGVCLTLGTLYLEVNDELSLMRLMKSFEGSNPSLEDPESILILVMYWIKRADSTDEEYRIKNSSEAQKGIQFIEKHVPVEERTPDLEKALAKLRSLAR